MSLAPFLFFHCVDALNQNAQANNTKSILARWDSSELPAAAFYFREPDPGVARNPNVRLIKLPSNRLWKWRAMKVALGSFSGTCFPVFAPVLDSRVMWIRRVLRRQGVVISTLEGLPADASIQVAEAERLSGFAGHRVFPQAVSPENMAALNSVKSHSDLIIAISPFLRRMASQMWPETSVVDIPLGVNLEQFHSRGRKPHASNARVHVVSAGSFQSHKRPEVFLELARRHPQVNFSWFGDGEMRAPLLQEARAEGISNLAFPGAIDTESLAEALRAADIFTLPSISEGVPKVTQEASACGLPVVCMEYYESFSVVQGVNGFQAPDDATYFDNVARLIDDAVLRARMGKAGAEMAKGWSWDVLAKCWQRIIYETVCRGLEGRTSVQVD